MYLNQNIILINTLPRELENSEANKMTHARKLTSTAEAGTFTRKMPQEGPMCRPALPLANLGPSNRCQFSKSQFPPSLQKEDHYTCLSYPQNRGWS